MTYPVTANLAPRGDDPTGLGWVLYHTGKSCAVLHRWRQLLRAASPGGWGAVRVYAPGVMRLVADPRVLRTAVELLASGGPKAPGPNGLRLEDLADDERWQMAAALARAVRRGRYRSGDQAVVWVGKASGLGRRPIVLSDVQDRVVEKAAALVLRPMLDGLFDPRSFAYRPWRTREQAVAVAERLTLGGHPVWLPHDLVNAYGRVPVPRLLDAFGKLLPCPRLRDFLGRVLPPRAPGPGGIKQGGPLSPLALEVYLNHTLDRPWRAAGHPVLQVRYADDSLFVAADAGAARAADAALRGLLLPAGMLPKATFERAAADLRSEPADWLGFRFDLAGADLRVRLTDAAYEKLGRRFVLAHRKCRPAERAVQLLEGWVDQLGPCHGWEDVGAACRRARETAAAHGFSEATSEAVLRRRWGAAAGRWEQTRRAVRATAGYFVTHPVEAPTPTSVIW